MRAQAEAGGLGKADLTLSLSPAQAAAEPYGDGISELKVRQDVPAVFH
jgi:hypothetical protein